MLRNFLEKYWKLKKLKKWNFLYKSSENDQNLYLINKWQILLSVENREIAVIWENEISWEKSFLKKTAKPIDAQAITEAEVLYITPDEFNKLDDKVKNDFLVALTVFISDRVFLLNDIINSISLINKKFSTLEPSLSLKYLQNIFSNLIDIKEIFIYKVYEWAILPIYESKLNPSIQEQIQKVINKERTIISGKDSFLIKVDYYILYLKVKKNKNDYIITNTFIHSINTLKYLAERLEELQVKELNDLLK